MLFKFDRKKLSKYEGDYSSPKLLKKLGKVARKAGVKVVYAVLLLYYSLMDDHVTMKDKAVVLGALGYFILPFDLIPDILGPLGYTDDMTALTFALLTVWGNIKPETHEKAKHR
ncbi:MAG: DUF1232 domain-containing protein, partial [Muribaculaceae bacterium]|nr:DUF1232 domain-containing protein [Muribaculaceae bacterium]